MSTRQIEMFWRCSSCQHRNLGRHLVCQHCKKAKDGSEQYEMPEDTASAATVTDTALLRMATAGPNWRCAYCDSDQRALNGDCENCGASAPPSPEPSGGVPPRPEKKPLTFMRGCFYVLLGLLFFGCCCPMGVGILTGGKEGATGARDAGTPDAGWTQALQVKEVSWEHLVDVERYRASEREGFAELRPANALQVKARGSRHHHDDQVLDGYETVYYTEQRQDGYTTESYREQEACGQDCSTTPRSCREQCTSNKNGFATCKTSCTGGERRCSTRYCSVTKTRRTPRYVDERRSRQEPHYRSVPRNAPWYSWTQWDWAHDRTVKKSGSTLETYWPSDVELRPVPPLEKGQKERTSRSAKYRVVFQGGGAPPVMYTPATLEEFQQYAVGSTHTLQEKDGQLTVVPKAPPPAPSPAPSPASVK
ncbi:hypothetical protein DRW03_25720 [Corallococcus sp. H22C18031201]|nr:hypothetical protein DRW03_25720 [Corallococcus sp. H22C18031201]